MAEEESKRKDFAEEIDYFTEYRQHSDVIYRYLQPQNTATVTLGSGQAGPTTIIIPPSPFNLSKSSLNFQIQINALANSFTWVDANTLTVISRMRLTDQFSNAIWMDTSNFNQCYSVLTPMCTEIKKFLTKSFYGTLPNTSSANSQLCAVEDISRCCTLPLSTQGTTYVTLYTAPNNYTGYTPSGSATPIAVDLFPQNPYTSRQNFYVTATTNAAFFLDVNIPLSAIKLSVLQADKLLWNAANLQLDIYWNQTDNFAFNNTVGGSVANGGTSPSSGTIASISTTAQLNNIQLVLANENNLQLVTKVIDLITHQGLSLPIPWITTVRTPIAQSTAHSYQIPMQSAYGNSLLFNITAPFQSSTTGALAFYANRFSRGSINTYNTFLNNISIANPNFYNALQSQDFMVGNRKFLQGSVVQTLGEYIDAYWCHIDSFMGTAPIWYLSEQTDKVDGLDLRRQNAVWQLQCTLGTSTALTWLNIIVGQKTLQLSSQGSLVY